MAKEAYAAYVVEKSGMEWLGAHQDELELRRQPIKTVDDDIPF